MPQPTYRSTPQLESMAKSQGFPSYEAMMLFESQRDRQRDALRTGQAGQVPQARKPPPPSRKAEQIMSWHPAVIFNKIANVLGMANDPEQK